MNAIKTLISLICTLSFVIMTNAAQAADSYTIDKFWANGDNWMVTYSPPATTSTTLSTSASYKVVHDATAKVVTFSFFDSANKSLGGCSVGINSVDGSSSLTPVYLQAVELAKNSALISFFHVSSWGATCYQLSRVEYRTDLKMVNVTCNNATTYMGQSVYIVGNTPRLGNWNSAKAIKLNVSTYPQWRADVVVENDTNIEWKCVKHEEVNPALGVVWSAGANRTFYSGTTTAVSTVF